MYHFMSWKTMKLAWETMLKQGFKDDGDMELWSTDYVKNHIDIVNRLCNPNRYNWILITTI